MSRRPVEDRVRDIMDVWDGFHSRLSRKVPGSLGEHAGAIAGVAAVLTILDASQPVLEAFTNYIDRVSYPPINIDLGDR